MLQLHVVRHARSRGLSLYNCSCLVLFVGCCFTRWSTSCKMSSFTTTIDCLSNWTVSYCKSSGEKCFAHPDTNATFGEIVTDRYISVFLPIVVVIPESLFLYILNFDVFLWENPFAVYNFLNHDMFRRNEFFQHHWKVPHIWIDTPGMAFSASSSSVASSCFGFSPVLRMSPLLFAASRILVPYLTLNSIWLNSVLPITMDNFNIHSLTRSYIREQFYWLEHWSVTFRVRSGLIGNRNS